MSGPTEIEPNADIQIASAWLGLPAAARSYTHKSVFGCLLQHQHRQGSFASCSQLEHLGSAGNIV